LKNLEFLLFTLNCTALIASEGITADAVAAAGLVYTTALASAAAAHGPSSVQSPAAPESSGESNQLPSSSSVIEA
jgi:hypothetical protein